jgi:arsenite methyltransferase
MMDICPGDMCRPGGFEITDRAMAFCCFPPKAKLADIGCGFGATVEHIRKLYGYEIWGIEKDEEIVKRTQSKFVLTGDGNKLPFADGELDGIMFECSLSKMDHPQTVLAESRRVLKPQGYLIVSDMYARGKGATLSGLLGRVETKEELYLQLTSNGFPILLFDDYSQALQRMWAQLIFQFGTEALWDNLGSNCAEMRQVKCGYCLIIGQKGEKL